MRSERGVVEVVLPLQREQQQQSPNRPECGDEDEERPAEGERVYDVIQPGGFCVPYVLDEGDGGSEGGEDENPKEKAEVRVRGEKLHGGRRRCFPGSTAADLGRWIKSRVHNCLRH